MKEPASEPVTTWEGATDGRRHVLLLLSRDGDRRVLAEALDGEYTTHTSLAATTNQELDLCLVDGEALRQHRASLEAAKEAAKPLFLPYLLVARERPGRVDPTVSPLVDEVIRAPIDVRELRARLASLLRIRRLSVEVSERRYLEEMATVLSHDLRNPLNVAAGNLELARAEHGANANLEAVESALERMDSLVDDMLTLAEQGYADPALEATSLRDAAERAWAECLVGDTLLDARVDGAIVVADENRLMKLFSNLYRNASEHNDGGVVVTVGTTPNGFYVEDDGVGIPKSERTTVFETGYTTNDDGTGFGLSIVERIAEAHGWTLTVTESSSGGARFEVDGVTTLDDAGAGGAKT